MSDIPRSSYSPATASTAGSSVAGDLLGWYGGHRRQLPWRADPGETADPYRVWLSEIMLQQTTVAAVKPYFARFVARWPDVRALAAAPVEEVMKAWAGLGYYSRARNLHACAKAVVESEGGAFPSDEARLRVLPGIGAYTSAAIAAIAFGERAVVVDGNVERVMARLFAIGTPLPAARPALRAAMDDVTPMTRAGDFAQAVMDLGATICTPRSSACVICPISSHCRAREQGDPATYPRKAPKKSVPERFGAVFLVTHPNGSLLVRQRPSEGLFGGMTEFPGTAWTAAPADVIVLPPGVAGPITPIGRIRHGLTHFTLELDVFLAQPDPSTPADVRWVAHEAVSGEALPTLMRKVLALASPGLPHTAADAAIRSPRLDRL